MDRPRRLRRTPALRSLVRETTLAPSQLIWPAFVVPGKSVRRPIGAMPGQFQLSIDQLVREAGLALSLGIRSVLLFGVPDKKDLLGREAYASNGIIQQAVRALKKAHPGLIVMTDLCFCEYTSHGHCGVLKKGRKGTEVDNDATLELIRKTAVVQAEAGADVIAPSGMMDGAVAAIREALDRKKHEDVAVMAYAAKFASAFYGPFREAAGSTPQFGDRRAYQMDVANGREAVREAKLDAQEGADIVMVKPALACLDVIQSARANVNVPIAAYNVSGEYAMVKSAGRMGWLDEQKAMMEVLTAIRRAGADLIITYHAMEAARALRRGATA